MPSGYSHGSKLTRAYEITQLLRVNGARVKLIDTNTYAVKLGGVGKWTEHHFTAQEFRKRYGPGSMEYEILRRHPLAATIPVARARASEAMESLA